MKYTRKLFKSPQDRTFFDHAFMLSLVIAISIIIGFIFGQI